MVKGKESVISNELILNYNDLELFLDRKISKAYRNRIHQDLNKPESVRVKARQIQKLHYLKDHGMKYNIFEQ